jgi:hypothetical protein
MWTSRASALLSIGINSDSQNNFDFRIIPLGIQVLGLITLEVEDPFEILSYLVVVYTEIRKE